MHITRILGTALFGLAFSNALAAPLGKGFSPTYVGFSADNARACLNWRQL